MEQGGLPTNLLVIIIAVMAFVFSIAGLVVFKVMLAGF